MSIDDNINRVRSIRNRVDSVRDSAIYSTVCDFFDKDVKWLIDEVELCYKLIQLQDEEAKHLIETVGEALQRVQVGLFAEAKLDMTRDDFKRLTEENERLRKLSGNTIRD